MSAGELTVSELERWERFGAQWRTVELATDRVVVELCACTGETMARRVGTLPETIAYVRAARHAD